MSDAKLQDDQTSGSGEKTNIFLPFMRVAAILVTSSIGCHPSGCFSAISTEVSP